MNEHSLGLGHFVPDHNIQSFGVCRPATMPYAICDIWTTSANEASSWAHTGQYYPLLSRRSVPSILNILASDCAEEAKFSRKQIL